MPGICGYFCGDSSPCDLLSRMIDAMTHFEWYQCDQHVAEHGSVGLGRVNLGFVNVEPQPAALDGGSMLAVMDGELSNPNELRANLSSNESSSHSINQAEVLLLGYQECGVEFLQQARGKFSAAFWDGKSGDLLLIADPYGMKPLYYVAIGQNLFFASEIKALLTCDDVATDRNAKGIVQFFTFGHLWGNETLYNSIRVVPPASVVRFRRSDRSLTISAYAKLPQPRPGKNTGEILENIDLAFCNSVEETVQHSQHLGLALSGGLDARTILGLIDVAQHPLKALCVGMPGSRDQRSARQMAALKGCEYHDVFLDQEFLKKFDQHLDRMVYLTDGHYLSQCIVLPTFPKYRELGIEVLLRGHAGELMHMGKAYSFSLDAQAFQLQTERQLQDWLFQHLRAYMLDALDEPLFEFANQTDCNEIARETIRESLQTSETWERPTDRIWQVFITERLRRETAMSLVKFNSVVETRLPYLSPQLLDALALAPAELKQDEEIQAYILRKRYPQFLKITNVNTGARVGASSFTKRLQSLKTRAFAKLGVPGYQPYERLGLWLRRELRPLVTRILLSDRCLMRGVFRADAVRQVVEQHFSGKRNHTFLLMAMMIYERGQQMFADQFQQSDPLVIHDRNA